MSSRPSAVERNRSDRRRSGRITTQPASPFSRPSPSPNKFQPNSISNTSTLVPITNDSTQNLIDESTKTFENAFNMDWKMPSPEKDLDRHDNVNNRRSLRSTLMAKARSSGLEGTASTLGKRGRDVYESSKERVQGIVQKGRCKVNIGNKENQGPATKRKRVTTQSSKTKHEVTEEAFTAQPKPAACKKWLSRGMYSGVHRGFDPKITTIKNDEKNSSQASLKERKHLPLPMFAGEMLLQNGRPFRLPFDVCSPLPPGSKRPEDWRKIKKSKSCHVVMLH